MTFEPIDWPDEYETAATRPRPRRHPFWRRLWWSLTGRPRPWIVERCRLITIDLGGGYLVPTTQPDPAEPQPVAVIEIDGAVTEQQAQQVRDSIQVFSRPRSQPSSEPMRCPCVAIYSTCTCKHRTSVR